MNIFEWHEDKTPKELATELGISDFAVVENAGKESIKILDNHISNTKEDSNNGPIWTDSFLITDLEIGMLAKVDIEANGIEIWYISSINKEENTFVITWKDKSSTVIDKNSNNILVYLSWIKKKKTSLNIKPDSIVDPFLWLTESDINDKEQWEQILDWNDFEIGMRVTHNIVWKIISIYGQTDIFKEITIIIEYADGSTKEINDMYDSLENIFVYSEDLGIKTTLWNQILEDNTEWISNYTIDDLERNIRVKKKTLWKKEDWEIHWNWYIADTNIEKNEIKLINNGHNKKMKITDFYRNFDLYRDDIINAKFRYLWNIGEWTLWYVLDDLKIGSYLKENNNLYKIRKIDGNKIYLRNIYNVDGVDEHITVYYDNLFTIQNKYYLLQEKKSINKVDEFLGINKDDLLDEDKWENNFNANDIKLGQRVKNSNGIWWKIITLEFKKLIVEFTDGVRITYESFGWFKTDFTIWKQDLK